MQSQNQKSAITDSRSKDINLHKTLYDSTRNKMNKTTINF